MKLFSPNQNPGDGTGTTSSLCTAYYTKITILNNLKLTVLLLIVNVYITEIVSRAPRSLICISIELQLHTVTHVPMYEYFHALLSAHPNIFDILWFPSIKGAGLIVLHSIRIYEVICTVLGTCTDCTTVHTRTSMYCTWEYSFFYYSNYCAIGFRWSSEDLADQVIIILLT